VLLLNVDVINIVNLSPNWKQMLKVPGLRKWTNASTPGCACSLAIIAVRGYFALLSNRNLRKEAEIIDTIR
jgi:hypothetical protein